VAYSIEKAAQEMDFAFDLIEEDRNFVAERRRFVCDGHERTSVHVLPLRPDCDAEYCRGYIPSPSTPGDLTR
jgi:hypothetical protein